MYKNSFAYIQQVQALGQRVAPPTTGGAFDRSLRAACTETESEGPKLDRKARTPFPFLDSAFPVSNCGE